MDTLTVLDDAIKMIEQRKKVLKLDVEYAGELLANMNNQSSRILPKLLVNP